MKFKLTTAILAVSAVVWADSERFTMYPVSPRNIQIGKNAGFTLVQNSQIGFEVVVPAGSDAKIKAAAKELCDSLETIFGSRITPVMIPSGNKFAIRLGYVPEKMEIDRDGFLLRTGKNDLEILGDRAGYGLQFGVYDFLERFAGVRFYFPGKYGTILPKKKDWRLPEINIMDRPDSQHRRIRWVNWDSRFPEYPWYEDGKDSTAALNLFKFRLRLSTNRLPNVHGLINLGLVQRFGKSHPEYFALNAKEQRMDGSVGLHYPSNKYGQICFSSPGLKEEIYQDAVAALTGKPASSRNIVNCDGQRSWGWTQQRPFFNIMPNDGLCLCHCPECWKAFSGHPRAGGNNPLPASELVWSWQSDIARRLQKNGIPGYVTAMAYTPYDEVPKNVDIPSNMIVMLAVNGPWDELNPEKRDRDDARLKTWAKKLGAKLYLWNYPTKCCVNVPDIPNTSPRAFGTYFPRQFPYSFGTFLESETDCWLFGYLNYYVFSKLMWNKDANVDALLKEHCHVMFGGGADAMLDFFDSMEKHWMNGFANNMVDTLLGPQSVPPTEFQIWNKIFSPVEMKRIDGLFARAEKSAGSQEAAERVRYIHRRFWSPVEQKAAEYRRRSAGKEEWTAPVPEILNAGTMTVDGLADEPVWKTLAPVWLLPLNSDKAQVQTTIRMFRDRDNWWFFFECQEPSVSEMRLDHRAFDDPKTWSDNAVEIYLDPTGKRQSYYQIMVNAYGNVSDLLKDVTKHAANWKWNSNARVKCRIQPGKGWTAEVCVPRKSMPESSGDFVYGNFTRYRPLKNLTEPEQYMWSCLAIGFGDVDNFGRLNLKKQPDNNLLKDGDFLQAGVVKSSQDAWFDWGANLQRDTETYRTGGVSIRLDNKHRNLVQRLPGLKPDTEYVFSFYAKLENIVSPGRKDQVGGFTCRMSDGAPAGVRDSVRSFPQPPHTGTMPWQYFEYKFRTVPETGKAKMPILYFIIPPGNGRAWIDHVSLKEVGK